LHAFILLKKGDFTGFLGTVIFALFYPELPLFEALARLHGIRTAR
jgi:hypothetical protein